MTFQQFFDATWVSLLGFVMALVVGINLIRTKNPGILKGKGDFTIYKDAEQYATKGGYLMLLFALGCLVNAGLMLYSAGIAFAEAGVICIGVVILWKNMSIKYGPVR